MADKELSVKNATDKELGDLISRLRKEMECLDILASLKQRTSNIDSFTDYNSLTKVSAEEPVNNAYHEVDEFFKHVGIMGMHWGKGRKNRSFQTTRTKSPNSSDHDKAQALKAKGMKNLSNDQINTLLRRLNLEKQMRDNKVSDLKRGEEIVRTILGIGTTLTAIYGLSKSPLGEAIKKKLAKTP